MIDEDDAKRLRKKKGKRLDEKFALCRYDLEQFWCASVEDEELSIIEHEFNKVGWLVKAREWYERVDQELEDSDRYDVAKNHVIDYGTQVAKRELIDIGLSKLGIDGPDCIHVFSKSAPNVERFSDWAIQEEMSHDIKALLGMSVDGERMENEPLRVVGDFIKKAGMTLTKSKQVRENGERIRITQLDVEINEVIESAITRRTREDWWD